MGQVDDLREEVVEVVLLPLLAEGEGERNLYLVEVAGLWEPRDLEVVEHEREGVVQLELHALVVVVVVVGVWVTLQVKEELVMGIENFVKEAVMYHYVEEVEVVDHYAEEVGAV